MQKKARHRRAYICEVKYPTAASSAAARRSRREAPKCPKDVSASI